jgi:hypothetical protein
MSNGLAFEVPMLPSSGMPGAVSTPYWEKMQRLRRSKTPKHVALFKRINAGFLSMKAMSAASLHTDTVLSNLSVQYANNAYIGLNLLPVVNVDKQSNLFPTFDRRSMMAFPDDELGPRASANELTQDTAMDSYAVRGYGFKTYVDQQTLDNQDAPFDALGDATLQVNEGILFKEEKRIITVVCTAANYAGNTLAVAPSDAWNSTGGGDPQNDIDGAVNSLWVGRGPSKKVGFTTLRVWNVLKKHPKFLELFKYTTPGLPAQSVLANMLGLDELYIAESRQDTANIGQTVAFARMWPDVFGVLRVSTGFSIRNASFGYTIRFKDKATNQWFDPSIGTNGGYYTRTSVQETHKVIAPDTGFLITAPIV